MVWGVIFGYQRQTEHGLKCQRQEVLETKMIITVDPGIYSIDLLLKKILGMIKRKKFWDRGYKNVNAQGIQIEDYVVEKIMEGGC